MKTLEKAPDFRKLLGRLDNSRLLKIVMDEDANRIINDINEKYHYWDKVRHLKMPGDLTAEEAWTIAKIRRHTSPYRVQFGKYSFMWFSNSYINEKLHFFDLYVGGSMESTTLFPKEDKNRYLVSSIMEEAIASSQIEGAVTTREQAKSMLRNKIPPKNVSEQMIFNNFITIKKIVEFKNENLTKERLFEIHRLITKSTLSDTGYEGKFRENDNVKVVDVADGDVVHHPPSYKELDILIESVCDFFNEDKHEKFIHPIVKGCILHFMIGFIHPFVDGNGRTARALFYWYLIKRGYWLTEYLSISKMILRSKTQYAKAFLYTEEDDNDLTYFINYNLKTMDLAYESLRAYIQRKLQEKRQTTEILRIGGINNRQATILTWVLEDPSLYLTVKETESKLVVSNQTARTDLQKLVGRKFLKLIRLDGKTDAFVAVNDLQDIIKKIRK